ncbi:pyridoxamine 5'-phosphate oxidase family protein [Deefgea piscis]|uniref:Pyridoxamine 5'-phosphate oxidase family protein n=1 Tax=Deefgea piscis TaxID=2739061 RepID=A0A6M8SPB1_9NEIS|nr:pyridoxamine 5'-phosphate oxidase family protein [Deefgea piscis]QKJ66541.1 pyridoxamine 5'-phosphate oxidase family protein [Deefgea piscis]
MTQSSALFSAALALLRQTQHGVLATQSLVLPGYPHASWLPLVLDEAGRIVLVMSRLAEHTQNVLLDEKVSFLVHEPSATLSGARLTILGDLQPVPDDPLLLARLARQNPQLASYLAMADFSVWRLWPRRARYIAGFGKMGWIEGDEWETAAQLSLADESALIQSTLLPEGCELIGVDWAGCDLRRNGQLERHILHCDRFDLAALRAAIDAVIRA